MPQFRNWTLKDNTGNTRSITAHAGSYAEYPRLFAEASRAVRKSLRYSAARLFEMPDAVSSSRTVGQRRSVLQKYSIHSATTSFGGTYRPGGVAPIMRISFPISDNYRTYVLLCGRAGHSTGYLDRSASALIGVAYTTDVNIKFTSCQRIFDKIINSNRQPSYMNLIHAPWRL